MGEKLIKEGVPDFGNFLGNYYEPNLIETRKMWNIRTPRFLKKLRLKEWQAFQLWIPGQFIFGAVYNARITGIVILSVYEIDSGKLSHFSKKVLPWKIDVAKDLFNTISVYSGKSIHLECINKEDSFEIGAKTKMIKLNLKGKRKINALNVLLPLGKNRSMYSHKALLPVEGKLKTNKTENSFGTEKAQLIIDHHKGFYPYNLSYDWATATWRNNNQLIGFNLTRNQAENPDVFNENCLWVENELIHLPAVQFTFHDKFWQIKSKCGSVNIQFNPKINNPIKFNLGLIAVNYNAPYGTFTGEIKIQNQSFIIDNAFGVAERKRYRM